jgi:PBP1b-binding outer membrane lipoprotein LpoB
MRCLIIPVFILLLSGCVHAPKKHVSVPSTVGVRTSLNSLKGSVSDATAYNAKSLSHIDKAADLNRQINELLKNLSK